MSTKSKFFSTLTILTILGLIFMLPACDQEPPMGVEEPAAQSSGQVTILKMKDAPESSLKKLYIASARIDDDGGRISVGDYWSGISYIDFPEDAISSWSYPNGVAITFAWESEGLMQAHFSPEGLAFRKPAYIRLSYKNANLTGVNEYKLGIYYYNPATNNWEAVSHTVNTYYKYVEGYINHFSLYAIGME